GPRRPTERRTRGRPPLQARRRTGERLGAAPAGGRRRIFPCVEKISVLSTGMLAGQYASRCEKCIREQKEIEENQLRERERQERQQRIERERQERQQRIKAAAASLQRDERSRLATTVIPSIKELRSISPQLFEDEIAHMFRRLGYEVKQTPYVNDYGRDAILMKDGKKFLLECKRYGEGGSSGRPDLQKFHSAITTDGAVSGFFVTTGRFTRDAMEFRSNPPIKLIDGNQLVRMMFESKPMAGDDDSYRSMCHQCEEIVYHRLRAPQSITCRNGHEIAPTLNLEQVLSVSAEASGSRRARRRRHRRR